ncbi:MAG: ribonuclease HI family protein [Candidatus Saccharimonadales bacterium]
MSENHKYKHKEKALLTALRLNKTLIREGKRVYLLDVNGQRELLSESSKVSDTWEDAIRALLDPPKEKDCKEDTDCLIIYTDGGSRGNPGPSASGYVIMDKNENLLEDGGQYLGISTNNQAEYRAVLIALYASKKFNPKRINVFMDSLLVVNQLKGSYKVRNKDLEPIYKEIKELQNQFQEVSFEHVYREYNKLADEQVNLILDQQQSQLD